MEPALILRTSTVLLAITAVERALRPWPAFGSRESPHLRRGSPCCTASLLPPGSRYLAYAYFTMPVPAFAATALLLFLLAAAGGVLMNLRYHLQDLPLPVWLVLVHAAVAVIAFLLLALSAWGGKR